MPIAVRRSIQSASDHTLDVNAQVSDSIMHASAPSTGTIAVTIMEFSPDASFCMHCGEMLVNDTVTSSHVDSDFDLRIEGSTLPDNADSLVCHRTFV